MNLNVGRGKGLPHAVGAYNMLEANYSPIPFLYEYTGIRYLFSITPLPAPGIWGLPTTMNIASPPTGGEMDYYFIYGPRFPAMLEQYTALTGRSPLLPRFALGLQVGTYSGGTWGYEQNDIRCLCDRTGPEAAGDGYTRRPVVARFYLAHLR